MPIKLCDLNAQYQSMWAEIEAAIANVIADAVFIGGKYVSAFEEQFADYSGVKYCVGCANGTDALEIALEALGIGKGDEVIVPGRTWISTAEAVTRVGATPVFVDTDPELYTVAASKIEERITPQVKAIIPVHFYGLPAEMDNINALARKYGLKILEDCAQAHGAAYKGRKIGTFGDAATFSFYPAKNLGAYGDAGCIITNDESLAATARMIANHGRLGKHDHKMEGRNSRLDSLQAAILSAKLRHLEDWTEARRRHADLYRQQLAETGIQVPIAPGYSRHVYHLFVVQVPERDRVQADLRAHGIETGIHYPIALPFLKAYERMGYTEADFPVAARDMHRILSLPMYPELTEAMISKVCETLKASLASLPSPISVRTNDRE